MAGSLYPWLGCTEPHPSLARLVGEGARRGLPSSDYNSSPQQTQSCIVRNSVVDCSPCWVGHLFIITSIFFFINRKQTFPTLGDGKAAADLSPRLGCVPPGWPGSRSTDLEGREEIRGTDTRPCGKLLCGLQSQPELARFCLSLLNANRTLGWPESFVCWPVPV